MDWFTGNPGPEPLTALAAVSARTVSGRYESFLKLS